MTKLLLLWGAWRLARALTALLLLAALAMVVLSGGGETSVKPGPSPLSKVERAIQPVDREIQRMLERGAKP
jgi:hypothetical protein